MAALANFGAIAFAAKPAPAPTAVAPVNPPAHTAKKPHVRHFVRRKRQNSADDAFTGLSERISRNTIAVIAGGLGSTDLAVANDLAAVLDDGDNLRILPVVGAGGSRNIRDVRFIKGLDLAITQTDLLARMRASREIGPLDDKIVYVAKLFNEELHVLVRADSDISAIGELNGRTVSLGEPGSGTQIIGRDVLNRLGLAVHEVNLGETDAIARLKAGEVDAVMLIDGKPVPALASAASDLRVLPVPFVKALRDDFLPARLTSEDYPGLIEPGRRVETVAVGTVLVAFNWSKDSDPYGKIERFVGAFFPRLAQLQAPPHHPKWREVNLAATLPGWTRMAAAQDWLDQHREPDMSERDTSERDEFDEFVRARGGPPASADERERLFREFMEWSEARARR